MTVVGEAARAAARAKVNAEVRVTPDRIAPLLLGALALGVALLTVTPWPVGVFQDDAVYVVLAKALATGEGFRMINLPGAPHATHFPPGYPILLAALWRLAPEFPDNIVVFKFTNALFLAATAAGTYKLSRSRFELGALGASVASIVGTLSIVVLVITGVVLSEPMFMALLIPTLVVTERAVENDNQRTAAAAGVLIGILTLVRTLGLLLPAALLVMLLRRRWRSALVLTVVAAVFIVPWQLWVSAYQSEMAAPLVGKYGSYGQWLADGYRVGGWPFARAVLAKNTDGLFGFLGYLTMPVPPVWPRLISLGTVLLTLGLGAWSVRRRLPVTLVFFLGYAAVVLAWPFEPTRFVLVWWPLLAALFVAGVRVVWRWRPSALPGRGLRFALGLAMLLVVGGYGMYNLRGVRQKWWVNIQSDAGTRAKPIAEWVARSTTPNDVLITDHDLIVYLYTGRRAVPTATFTALGHITPLTPAQDAAVLRDMLTSMKPRWYIANAQQSITAATILADEQPPVMRYAGSISTARVYEPVSK